MDLSAIARALGGEVHGYQVLAPGLGHSWRDRSLSVRPNPRAPDGLLVHSFAGDDPLAAKDYVRRRLGRLKNLIPPPGKRQGSLVSLSCGTTRMANALRLL